MSGAAEYLLERYPGTEVGSADKFRDQRNAAAVGTRARGLAKAGMATGDMGQAGTVDEFVLFGRSMGLGQAVVELQVSFALLL